jgi:hypothetical protein
MRVYYSIQNMDFDDFGEASGITKNAITTILMYNRYKIMWALRSIEEIMNIEGGAIVITDNVECPIQVKGFSDELTAEIWELIKAESAKQNL